MNSFVSTILVYTHIVENDSLLHYSENLFMMCWINVWRIVYSTNDTALTHLPLLSRTADERNKSVLVMIWSIRFGYIYSISVNEIDSLRCIDEHRYELTRFSLHDGSDPVLLCESVRYNVILSHALPIRLFCRNYSSIIKKIYGDYAFDKNVKTKVMWNFDLRVWKVNWNVNWQ
jgi:hypothetical protein